MLARLRHHSSCAYPRRCAEPPYTNVDNVQLKALLAEGVPLYDIRWLSDGIPSRANELRTY